MKITPDHLARGAFIYIRQSTVDQLANNHESRRRQYGLADRARSLGWTDVTVIDDDLGRSGSGVSRPGFERLLAAICEGRVGAVFAIEASRLARNGRDWHTLIEFCGLVGTVIVDEDGTYEPRHPNDRLLLGMKGTMSELELSLLRARSMEALKQKARRGELFFTVAVGYVKVGRDKIEMDPDLRVREAIGLVFTRFAEMQSIRQVFLSLRGDQIALRVYRPQSLGTISGAVEATGLHDGEQPSHQPCLCRCLRLWPNRKSDDNRKWPQANRSRPPQRSLRLGSLARRPSRGLFVLGRL